MNLSRPTAAPAFRLLKSRMRGRSIRRVYRRRSRRAIARRLALRKGLPAPYAVDDDSDIFESWDFPAGPMLAPKGLKELGDRLQAASQARQKMHLAAADGIRLTDTPGAH